MTIGDLVMLNTYILQIYTPLNFLGVWPVLIATGREGGKRGRKRERKRESEGVRE